MTSQELYKFKNNEKNNYFQSQEKSVEYFPDLVSNEEKEKLQSKKRVWKEKKSHEKNNYDFKRVKLSSGRITAPPKKFTKDLWNIKNK